MKVIKKYLIPGLTCIAIGICLGMFFFKQYNPKENETTKVNNQVSETATFLQLGVYSSLDSMKQNMSKLTNYTYAEIDGKFHVFGAITQNKDNLEKVKKYYTELGFNSYSKDYTVNSASFIEVLKQYDLMLKETTDSKTIGAICSQVIAKYEELVNDENQGTTT